MVQPLATCIIITTGTSEHTCEVYAKTHTEEYAKAAQLTDEQVKEAARIVLTGFVQRLPKNRHLLLTQWKSYFINRWRMIPAESDHDDGVEDPESDHDPSSGASVVGSTAERDDVAAEVDAGTLIAPVGSGSSAVASTAERVDADADESHIDVTAVSLAMSSAGLGGGEVEA